MLMAFERNSFSECTLFLQTKNGIIEKYTIQSYKKELDMFIKYIIGNKYRYKLYWNKSYDNLLSIRLSIR